MPYNTRRKSICLPALGIQLPNSQSSRAHRPSLSKSSIDQEPQNAHPPKRLKRSHASASPSPETPAQSPSTTLVAPKTVTFADRPKNNGRHAYEHTPPPSPGASNGGKIDMDNIHDDIVAGVIEQLESTGNRPHLIKELASVLANRNASVNSSANPAALLSSRLAVYMKRSWTAESPCPVAKELIPVHPRKVFYYLTTTPRQDLPPSAMEMPPPIIGGRGKEGHKRIISPSLSNGSQDEDTESIVEERKREAMSPSPEVDLSLDLDDVAYSATAEDAPDFPTPPTPAPSYALSRSNTSLESMEFSRDIGLNRRSQPEMDGDEQEFTDTAREMRSRGTSNEDVAMIGTDEIAVNVQASVESTRTEEPKPDDANTLSLAHAQAQKQEHTLLSSPFVKPINAMVWALSSPRPPSARTVKEADVNMLEPSILGESSVPFGWEMRRPQSVGLDELDDLFDTY